MSTIIMTTGKIIHIIPFLLQYAAFKLFDHNRKCYDIDCSRKIKISNKWTYFDGLFSSI